MVHDNAGFLTSLTIKLGATLHVWVADRPVPSSSQEAGQRFFTECGILGYQQEINRFLLRIKLLSSQTHKQSTYQSSKINRLC